MLKKTCNQSELLQYKPEDGFVLGISVRTGEPFTINYKQALCHILLSGHVSYEINGFERLLSLQQIIAGNGLIQISCNPNPVQSGFLEEYCFYSGRRKDFIQVEKMQDYAFIENKKIVFMKVRTKKIDVQKSKENIDLGGIASLVFDVLNLKEVDRPADLCLTFMDSDSVYLCNALRRIVSQARSAKFSLCLSVDAIEKEPLVMVRENTWTKVVFKPELTADGIKKALANIGDPSITEADIKGLGDSEAFVRTGDFRLEKIFIPSILLTKKSIR